MPEPSMFLTAEQVAELTGVRAARNGVPRSARQSLALTRMGIPHYVNEIDRVIVVRAVLEGGRKADAVAKRETWVPNVLRGHGGGVDLSKVK